MKANKNVHSGESIDKEQMNLSVSTDTKEIIKKEAKDRYGSTKRMGQVLDEIVEEWMGTDDTEIKEQLDRIENKLDQSDENNSHTHTSDKVDSELLEKVENREEIDPDRWDLTVFKGDTEMVVNAGIGVLKHEKGDTNTISKKEVMKMVQSQFDYSINAARQKRDLILDELGPVLTSDGILDKLVEREIEVDLHKKKNGNKDHAGKPDNYRRQYNTLSEYVEIDVEFDVYVLNPTKYEQIVVSQLQHGLELQRSKQIRLRINSVLAELGYEVEDEPLILDY